MTTLRKSALVFLLLTVLVPQFVAAEPSRPGITLNENILPYGPHSILGIIRIITNWIFTILLVLAVIFLLLAAFNYMGGKEEGVAKAHRMLIYTAVAVAVALLSFGLVTAVEALVSAPRQQGWFF